MPCVDPTGYTKQRSIHEHKALKKINREDIRESKDVVGISKARLAVYKRLQEEQELLSKHNKKAKLSSIKKQAQLADISNTGTGTILVQKDSSSIPKSNDTSDIFDDWDDDLEAF